jgi:hypothetical protein
MPTARVADFRPSVHGFPFPNWFPPDRPFFLFDTPLGPVQFADATRGLCGGMIFTAIDLFNAGVRVIPAEPTDALFRHFCRRLFTSWGMPFTWVRYLDWQRRPDGSRFVAGVRTRRGVSSLMIESEWPKIQRHLEAGKLVPLGLVKQTGWSVRKLGLNHQVLAYGYDLLGDELTVHIYDPNYPGDDTAALRWTLADPDAPRMVTHSCEGANVRGVFVTEYRPPRVLPNFAEAGAHPPAPAAAPR